MRMSQVGPLTVQGTSRLHLAAIAVVLALSGCSNAVSSDDLPGSYVAEYPFGTERVTLSADGSYTQEIAVKDVKSVVNSGRWKYVKESHEVDLAKCLVASDGFGALRKDYAIPLDGGCSLPVEREYFLAGDLRLGPDEGFPLRKVR
jgi:hypothetical protein